MLSSLWVVPAMVWLLRVSATAATLWLLSLAAVWLLQCFRRRIDNDSKHDDELGFFHPGILFLGL